MKRKDAKKTRRTGTASASKSRQTRLKKPIPLEVGRRRKRPRLLTGPTSVPKKKVSGGIFKKFGGNPIIAPNPKHPWESKATFNPAAIGIGGRVCLLYRAVGDSDVSVLGYAKSRDGWNIEERLAQPVYVPRELFEGAHETPQQGVPPGIYVSGGGGWGGCEDPRLARIGERVYMTYVAFNGWGSVRMALTSIRLDDFLAKRWKWARPVLISPPDEIHKNWVLFPEKIKGKYAILHSIAPDILVDYFDSLDQFDNEKFIKSRHDSETRQGGWESRLRGVGPPPLKTKEGWLVLYHAMDKNDEGRYKLGAMILDTGDTTKILYRSKKPVLEPDAVYENQGFKAGIVYCCGAVIRRGKLLVYYGGADTVACVAEADLDTFLGELKKGKEPRLTRSNTENP